LPKILNFWQVKISNTPLSKKAFLTIKIYPIMNKIIIFFLLILSLTSCEKVITVDLNTTDPKVMIEGQVTDQAGGFRVKLSKTVNFSDANNFPAVKGAAVTITDNKGVVQALIESESGVYTLKDIKGVSGNTYTLKVVAEGKNYTSSSTMPKAVDLLGAEIQESAFSNGPGSTTKLYDYFPFFLDPVDVKNNYYFILSSKGKKDKGFFNIINDNLFNGSFNPIPLNAGSDFKVSPKDTVTIEMRCIDRAVFEYYNALRDITGGGSGTPANPVNNISGGALGYFSAHTVRTTTAIVP
jgi:hypothetical protein